MLRKWMLALCFCLGIFGCGCAETTSDESSTASSEATTATTQSTDEKTTRDLFAMDTYITLTAYGNNAEAGISAAECVPYKNGSLAVQDLINGNIKYVIIDSAPAKCITEAINKMQ